MYSFLNDYSECTHEKILENISQNLRKQNVGYGLDPHCEHARKCIKKYLDREDADIHFLIAGTPSNALAVASILRPFEAVISCDSGHINVHETGAIEATGHKVLSRPHVNGKLTCEAIQSILDEHTDEHMVKPKMVYISQTTEYGSIYTLSELKKLRNFTRAHDLYLFVDGARLGSALASSYNDVTLKDLAHYTDMFYIGGTKNGALMGEAMIILNDDLKKDFRFIMKNQGNLLAKGFLLGMQFETLFTDDLFFELGRHANQMATRMMEALKKKGIKFYVEPQSNQLFPWIPVKKIDDMAEKFLFSHMNIKDGRQMIRLVTSWATSEESVQAFENYMENF